MTTRTIRSLVTPALVLTLASAEALLAQTAAAPQSAAAARSVDQSASAARLAARAIGTTPLVSDLAELCDRIGGRPTGSPAMQRAIDWSARKLREAGLSVTLDPYTMPGLWLAERESAECVAPERFPLHVAIAPGSPSTPGGKPLRAPVVDAGDGGEEAFTKLGARARGAIALVSNPEMKSVEDLFGEYMRNEALVSAAAKAGVAALLVESSRPRGLLYRHPMGFRSGVIPMPAAFVAREQFQRLERLSGNGGAEVSLDLASKTSGPYETHNVVGELRGREKPEEIVVLGAHLDSWELGTGANDNGVNVALVIDVARGMKALGLTPRRTIRFVLFTGEELGMWGSAGYVTRHAAEMDRHAGIVIFDVGSGRTTGFYLNGREDLRKPVNEALGTVAGLSADGHSLEAIDGTDNFDFLLAGVPNIVAMQDWTPYLPDYHASSDTFDKVDTREAKANAAIASAVVWGLAESPGRLPRQTREQVEKLILDTKLDAQMKAFAQWDDWTARKRGAWN